MATRAPSADAVRASSEMFTGLSQQNRRALLGASLAGVVALAATASSAAALPLPAIAMTDTGPWDRAMAAYVDADRASESYNENIWKPCHAAVERAAPLPDLSFDVPMPSEGQVRYTVPLNQIDKFDHHPCDNVRQRAAARSGGSRRVGSPSSRKSADWL